MGKKVLFSILTIIIFLPAFAEAKRKNTGPKSFIVREGDFLCGRLNSELSPLPLPNFGGSAAYETVELIADKISAYRQLSFAQLKEKKAKNQSKASFAQSKQKFKSWISKLATVVDFYREASLYLSFGYGPIVEESYAKAQTALTEANVIAAEYGFNICATLAVNDPA